MSSLNIDIDIDIAQLNASTGSGTNRRAHPGSDLPNAWVDRSKATLAKEKETNDDKNDDTIKRYYPEYHEYWDADLQSYKYLNDFLVQNKDWLAEFAGVAEYGRKRPQRMNRKELEEQITDIRNRVKDRASRASEIINQDDAEGAISSWLNLLGIDPARNRATNLMVRVGRRVGEHVVMCLKAHFKSPRPSQLCLAINPLIDAPTTPSFPAGHALQAYLSPTCFSTACRHCRSTMYQTSHIQKTGPACCSSLPSACRTIGWWRGFITLSIATPARPSRSPASRSSGNWTRLRS